MGHRFLPPIILLAAAACAVTHESDDQVQPARLADLLKSYSIIDLTHPFDAETIYWPTADGFELTVDSRGYTEGGYYYEANSFCAAEHGGTHLDAPVHFAEGGWSADRIPVERLIGPAVRIDVSSFCLEDADSNCGSNTSPPSSRPGKRKKNRSPFGWFAWAINRPSSAGSPFTGLMKKPC